MGANIPQEPPLPDGVRVQQFVPALRNVLRELSRACNDAADQRIWRTVSTSANYKASVNDHVILVETS